MTVTASSVGTVYGTTTYSFTFSPVPTIASGEMIGFFFPSNFIGKYQANLNAANTDILVFPESDSIYIKQGTTTSSLSPLVISNVNNPDY